jgi:hypothetical protein
MILNAAVPDFALMADAGRDKKKQQSIGHVPMILNAAVPDFALMADAKKDKYELGLIFLQRH